MDNYKIKVKDEAESKEAQELFFELGAKQPDGTTDLYHSPSVFGLLVVEGLLNYVFADVVFRDSGAKELTLPQLRDLVVLKRNDVNDANYRSTKVSDGLYFKSCDGKFYFMFEGSWVLSEIETDEGLEPITQNQGLISGAEALRALADGKEVQWISKDFPKWDDIDIWNANTRSFLNEEFIVESGFKYRLKPQTIKLELELPKPFEPKDGELCYVIDNESSSGFHKIRFGNHSGNHSNYIQYGAWRTEVEVKQVVAQLRKLRGNNS